MVSGIIDGFQDHWQYLRRSGKWPFTILYLASAIFLNDRFQFHGLITSATEDPLRRWLLFSLHYALAYFPVLMIQKEKGPVLKALSRRRILLPVMVILVLATERTSHFHVPLAEWIASYPFEYYMTRLFRWLKLPALVLVLAFLIRSNGHQILQPENLRLRRDHARVVLLIILIMIPAVFLASFIPAFTEYYPRYRPTLASISYDIPGLIFLIPFEAAYGLFILATEILFRGFLVLGMLKYSGKAAILPMVALYCFLHFGKPGIEAVSSIFGGYILGVITLYGRSLIPAMAWHLSLAWLMEFFAWWQQQ